MRCRRVDGGDVEAWSSSILLEFLAFVPGGSFFVKPLTGGLRVKASRNLGGYPTNLSGGTLIRMRCWQCKSCIIACDCGNGTTQI